ncbi:MAG: single-stranded DNA-binding protein, partial [Planctomycetota bacterium]
NIASLFKLFYFFERSFFMNHVFLIGYLTADPESRQTTNGRDISRFFLALNRYYRNQEGEKVEETSFVEIEVFGRTASLCNEYLFKGKRVAVKGRIRQKRWEDSKGERRSRICIVADEVEFLSPKTNGKKKSEGNGDEDIPF